MKKKLYTYSTKNIQVIMITSYQYYPHYLFGKPIRNFIFLLIIGDSLLV